MNDFGTTVMLVGKTAQPAPGFQLEPLWATNFYNPPPTSPAQPQNLLRPTFMNGVTEWAHDVTVGNLGRVVRRGVPGVRVNGTGGLGDARARTRLQIGATGEPKMTLEQWQEYSKQAWVWSLIGTAGMASGIYHGWKRTKGSGWGTFWWGLFGAVFPVPTTAVSFAQGYAKPKGAR